MVFFIPLFKTYIQFDRTEFLPWIDFLYWLATLSSNVLYGLASLRDDANTFGNSLGSDRVVTSHHDNLGDKAYKGDESVRPVAKERMVHAEQYPLKGGKCDKAST